METDSLIGKGIGPYRILRFLGQGGFAQVYLAVHEGLGRQVALKVLFPSYAESPEFVDRFLREARISANLEHPNIVQVYDVGNADGYYYIAMQYVDGETLQAAMGRGARLEAEVVANIVAQVAGALDYAHGQGIIHRDVKPSNILIDRRGKAYLTDFGIARAAWSARVTKTGVSIGTPEYMSPEQALGRGVDARSDLYSLAVVLYEMICGRAPFVGENPLSVLHQIAYEPPPAPRALNPGISASLESVLLRGLAKRPEDRFQSGAEMVAALRGAPADRAMPVPKPVPAHAPKPLREMSLPILVPVLAFLALAGIVAVMAGVLLMQVLRSGAEDDRTPQGAVSTQTASVPTTIVPLASPSAPFSTYPPPGKPTRLDPCGQSVVVADAVTLIWNAAANCYGGSCWYEVEVNGKVIAEIVEGTSYKWVPKEARRCRWRVRAKTSHLSGDWSDACELEVVTSSPTPSRTPTMTSTQTSSWTATGTWTPTATHTLVPTATPTPSPAPVLPPEASLWSDRTEFCFWETGVVYWSTERATEVYLQDIPRSPSGSESLYIEDTYHKWHLRACNSIGCVDRELEWFTTPRFENVNLPSRVAPWETFTVRWTLGCSRAGFHKLTWWCASGVCSGACDLGVSMPGNYQCGITAPGNSDTISILIRASTGPRNTSWSGSVQVSALAGAGR